MTPYERGHVVCGTTSVYLHVDGAPLRDTDWWDVDGMLDDSGVFSVTD